MLSLSSLCATTTPLPPEYNALCIHAAALFPVSSLSAIPAIPGRDFFYNLNECKVYYVGGQRGTGALDFLCIVFS